MSDVPVMCLLFNKWFLSAYYVSGTLLRPGDTAANKTGKSAVIQLPDASRGILDWMADTGNVTSLGTGYFFTLRYY